MPQLIVQPGLGESLDRYLERLGRRGEEQRQLQQRRDIIQAEMDARASELRTRIISDSINQGFGLFTDEMQRDRASQRRIAEGDIASERKMTEGDVASERRIEEGDFALQRRVAGKRGQLTGRPAMQDMYSDLGIVTSHNSQFSFLMKETGLDRALKRARAGLENHPNNLRQGQITTVNDIESEISALEDYLVPNAPQGPFVEGMTDAIKRLLDITPAGKKKSTHLDSVKMNDGSDQSNPFPIGVPVWFDPSGKKPPEVLVHPLLEIVKGRIEQKFYDDIDNPKFKEWDSLDPKEQEKRIKAGEEAPEEFLDFGVGDGVAMLDVNRFNKINRALWGNADPADIAETLRGASPLEARAAEPRDRPEGETPFPAGDELGKLVRSAKGQEAQALDAIKQGRPVAFQGFTKDVLDRLLKKGADLTWPNLVEWEGELHKARYTSEGLELTKVKRSSTRGRAAKPTRQRPPAMVPPPGVMKQ